MDSLKEQDTKKHLIVLLPVSMTNDFELAHTIHWMAFQKDRDVVYMTVAESSEGSLALSRDMATMKAVTAGNALAVQWIQASPNDWVARLQDIYRPEDEIVCSEEQTIDRDLFGNVKLNRFVNEPTASELALVSGTATRDEYKKKRIPAILTWIGFLAIIALFTWLQIQVDAAVHGTLSTVILLILLCIEFGAIWVWNTYTIA